MSVTLAEPVLTAVHLLAFAAGIVVVGQTLMSAIRTFVLPRADPVAISTFVFTGMRRMFALRIRRIDSYLVRDRIMAIYAPISLVALAVTWVLLVAAGFTLMFWATGTHPISRALITSGSSVFTLGYERPDGLVGSALAFGEAGIGLGLIALLISYLPSIYAAFTRREIVLSLLEPLAGSPATPTMLILRHHLTTGLMELESLWTIWRSWFADVEESHTSLAALVFFRSPHPDRSWITSAGCVLDAASIVASSLEIPRSANSEFCIRAGFVTLRRIADFFGITYPADPQPGDEISVTREEFDAVLESLERRGVPLKSDRDQAWRDFAGWRVNYDAVLLRLCSLTMAPPARWSGDRAPSFAMPAMWRRRSSAVMGPAN